MFMKDKTIILAGGSGFIGQALAAHWGRNNKVIILSREDGKAYNNKYGHKPLETGSSITYLHWDARPGSQHGARPGGQLDGRPGGQRDGDAAHQWPGALEGCDLVVNL